MGPHNEEQPIIDALESDETPPDEWYGDDWDG